MKILKTLLIVVVALVALLLIIGLFVKKEYTVEREITINKPDTTVFNYIKYLKNQGSYSKWAKMDPNMHTWYKGTDATPGFISGWESKADSVGKGEQEIKKITEHRRVDYEIRFIEPFESTSLAYMELKPLGPQTLVNWGFNGKMKYPMNLMLLFMDIDKMVGNDLDVGLKNLKTELEK